MKQTPVTQSEEQFLASLRPLCQSLVAHAFRQIQKAVRPGGSLTLDAEAWQEAVEARRWILAEDWDHPLSFRHCCNVLDLSPARGRAWAKPLLERIEAARSGPGVPRRRARGCRPKAPAC